MYTTSPAAPRSLARGAARELAHRPLCSSSHVGLCSDRAATYTRRVPLPVSRIQAVFVTFAVASAGCFSPTGGAASATTGGTTTTTTTGGTTADPPDTTEPTTTTTTTTVDPTTTDPTGSTTTTSTTTETTETTAVTASSTGAPMCGDGKPDPGEACDDGPANADDAACTSSCQLAACGDGLLCPACGEECEGGPNDECDDQCHYKYRVVFVSSELYKADQLGGLAGADATCASLVARGAKPLLGRPFVAWLSVSDIDAKSRIGDSPAVPYRRTDGTTIAINTTNLLDAGLDVAIDRDETGAHIPGEAPVWTGTHADGLKAGGDVFCGDWTETDGVGRVGDLSAFTYQWTDWDLQDCSAGAHIYCIQTAPQ